MATKLKIKGTAIWPKLRELDEYQGNVIGYTIQVQPTEKEAQRIIAELQSALAEAKDSKDFAGKAWMAEPMIGVSEKNGKIIFKMKMKHEFENKKTGEIVKRAVPIFDKFGNILDQDIDVGNDSEVIVAFTPIAFHTNKNINGLSLRLEAVQVLELKEKRTFGGADYFGFDIAEMEEM